MKALSLTQSFHIHPLFFLLALSAFLTGAFYEFVILIALVLIHELGHYFTAKYYGWRISRIELWLFGGAVVSEEHNTRPFHEQVRVVLAGPVQHIWVYVLLGFLEMVYGPHSLLSVAFFYNSLILLFNLLPIWPLDGGKLVFYAMNQFFTFQQSLLITLLASIASMALVAFWLTIDGRWTLAGLLLTAFLLIENALEWKRRTYTLMRYLLFCTYRDCNKLKPKYIKVEQDLLVRDVLKNIRSNRNHLYVLKQSPSLYIVNEQECLHAYFEKKQVDLRLRDVPKMAL
ncbi:site-2 protease family protein [Halobacillus sp. BBL2006]|uniref:site-2 protease family protein n=1 Tax=Halobacillus sp. BBL2006 TaxID=1543706 RepID=UPI0005435D3C|nr:site-2 protease family protein [Halobacillus sp. BBL2006]KHE70605.1 stage IV sporulation protein FB [Halobacillus sp. BBL2006]